MWCELLEIGGITSKICDRWMQDETTTCGHCRGIALSKYPDPVPVCGCGKPGNHPVLCSYRRSFFEAERQAFPEEKAFALARIAGATKRDAAALAGGTPKSLDTPATRRYMADVLNERGVTDEVLADKIKAGKDCEMAIKVRDQDGKEEIRYVPDNTNQFRYTELAVKIKGGMAEKGQFSFGDGNIVFINEYSRNRPPDEPKTPEPIDVTPEGP